MTSARATRPQLEELHGLLANIFTDWLKAPEKHGVTASHMGVIRAFLRDNGVTKNLGQTKDIQASLEELAGMSVPFLPTPKG